MGVGSRFAEASTNLELSVASPSRDGLGSDGLPTPLNGDLKGLNSADDVFRRLVAGVKPGSSPSEGAEDMPAGARCRRFMQDEGCENGLVVLYSPWYDTLQLLNHWGTWVRK